MTRKVENKQNICSTRHSQAKICGDSWDSNTSRSPASCTKGVQTNRQTQYPPKKSTQRRNVTHFDPSLKILFQQKDKEVDFFPGFSIKFLMYF